MEDAAVIIPTLNGEKYAERQLESLRQNGALAQDLLILDSESNDATVSVFQAAGARVVTIKRGEFNHGLTRQRAVNLLPGKEFYVFLTQDAILEEQGSLGALLSSFRNSAVGLAYGRQLPRQGASPIETFARLRNYNEVAQIRSYEDRKRFGIKTTFCSNSFAAYRASALSEVGGFPEAFFAEDQVVAAKMLRAGWLVSYVPDACVRHSHDYTPLEDLRRYFDVGVFHSRTPGLLEEFGAAEGEGLAFVRAEVAYLMKSAPYSIPGALLRTLMKYAGYRLGRAEKRLPFRVKEALSLHPAYWRGQRRSSAR